MNAGVKRFLRVIAQRSGFTVLELIIFSAIFSVASMIFIGILVSITRIGARQSAAAEVNQQSQFLLQKIQYYIERASLVDANENQTANSLRLRMGASVSDPTRIYLSAGKVLLEEGGSGPQALTSDKVNITNLAFTKKANPPGHDSVAISFTMEYVTNNIQQKFVQSLTTAVARVSAANFDSDLTPSSSAAYDIGTLSALWRSINQIINFSGSNVGIGTASPNAKLHVSGSPGNIQVSGGDVYVDTFGKGIILRSPDNVYCWKITVNNAGALLVASSSPPCI